MFILKMNCLCLLRIWSVPQMWIIKQGSKPTQRTQLYMTNYIIKQNKLALHSKEDLTSVRNYHYTVVWSTLKHKQIKLIYGLKVQHTCQNYCVWMKGFLLLYLIMKASLNTEAGHWLKFTVSVLQCSRLVCEVPQTALQILAVSQEVHPESLRCNRLVNTRNPNKYLWGWNIKWTFWRLTFLFPMNNASQHTKVLSVLLSSYQVYLRRNTEKISPVLHYTVHTTSLIHKIYIFQHVPIHGTVSLWFLFVLLPYQKT